MGILLPQLGGDLVHAGAFFGDMLPSFSAKCSGTVYAFELVLENYLLARICLQRNRLENVHSVLGELVRVRHMDIGCHMHRAGTSRIAVTGQSTSILMIDSLGLSNLSIIQLHVVGFEASALTGAIRTLQRCRPIVMVKTMVVMPVMFWLNSGPRNSRPQNLVDRQRSRLRWVFPRLHQSQ